MKKELKIQTGFLEGSYMRLRRWAAGIKATFLNRKFGIETRIFQRSLKKQDDEEGRPYQPTPYGRLEKAMRFLKPTAEDVFVDLGCGKGRAVFLAATHPFKKVIGVEADKQLYHGALQNAAEFRGRKNGVTIELLHMDAADFDPAEGTVFFMFNPFGPSVLKRVLANIKRSLLLIPRRIRIAYYTPKFKAVLDEQAWLSPAGFIENQSCPVWESNRLLDRHPVPLQKSSHP